MARRSEYGQQLLANHLGGEERYTSDDYTFAVDHLKNELAVVISIEHTFEDTEWAKTWATMIRRLDAIVESQQGGDGEAPAVQALVNTWSTSGVCLDEGAAKQDGASSDGAAAGSLRSPLALPPCRQRTRARQLRNAS